MNRSLILLKLQNLTADIQPAAATGSDELPTLRQRLVQELVRNPELLIEGNRLHQTRLQAELTPELSRRFDELLATVKPADANAASALVFRRETAFQNNLLGASSPSWGAGMAPTKSFGPFLDEHGVLVWFDFFLPIQTVQVSYKGASTPLLLISTWGSIAPRKTYAIEAGSVWIASDLIASDPALAGHYTGLKVLGGQLDLSAPAQIVSGQIVLAPGTTFTLSLNLDQNKAPLASPDAGFDAQGAIIELPQTLSLQFNGVASQVQSGDAACTVFGSHVTFKSENKTPQSLSQFGQILVPYAVRGDNDSPDLFVVTESLSRLCTLKGEAKIKSASGWLLPATKLAPSQLGAAAGTGALCIGLSKGLEARWKGLKGTSTRLLLPALIAEPGMLSVIDFFATNPQGKQKWTLWRNAPAQHHSAISLNFGKFFPFIFITVANGNESLSFFCGHQCALDRPVDANGNPFKIESSIAFASILQTGKLFRAFLLDNDLLFDGNYGNPDSYQRCTLALRNAFFAVSRPYSLFFTGDLSDDENVAHGVVALNYGVYLYLPTLPDPYVASYTQFLSDPISIRFGHLKTAIVGVVKWPNRSEQVSRDDDPPYVYFKFAPLDQALLAHSAPPADVFGAAPAEQAPVRNFRASVKTFNLELSPSTVVSPATLPSLSGGTVDFSKALKSTTDTAAIQERVALAAQSGSLDAAVQALAQNSLLAHLPDTSAQVRQTLDLASANADRAASQALFGNTLASVASKSPVATPGRVDPRSFFAPDTFLLLDVSSRADQMGVSFGHRLEVVRDPNGDARLQSVDMGAANTLAASTTNSPLHILNLDVVTSAQYLRAVTLPQISWEPIWNIPLAIEGPPDPADLITVTPGLLVYDNDGTPTRIFSESPYQVPITPLSVTQHFVREFNDPHNPRALRSLFTLPFAMVAQAEYERNNKLPDADNARVTFNQPYFDQLRGGLQIKTLAPRSKSPDVSNSFSGWTLQLSDYIKWGLFGWPISGSTLGKTVSDIFNQEFLLDKPAVPLEAMEVSGYGASIFSNWHDQGATIAAVSQAKFDVLVGRTASEVIQVRSILYPFAVHLVRTITLTRSANGYVFRSDSGWKAESDGFYDFSYTIEFKNGSKIPVPNPYEVHPGAVKGVSNVREIKDFPAGGQFTSSFVTNDPGLPVVVSAMTLAQWQDIFAWITARPATLPVKMQAVVFDADVHLDNVASGGVPDPTAGDFVVQSRKMHGYVQLSPSSILVPDRVFADLLRFQNGSLGGPVNCTVDVANSKQLMRVARVDVSTAFNSAGTPIFVGAARGSLILPPDGSWSVVKHLTDTGDVQPVEQGQSVPLIRRNGDSTYRVANPTDVVEAASSKTTFGVLQSTGTQKLLFDIPQFTLNEQKLKSADTYFADAYKLLNSKGVFPNLSNALRLTAAEREVDLLGDGLMKMAERTIQIPALLPPNFQYTFIDEPGILKVYAEYKSTGGTDGALKLGIDSAAALADRWKAALSSIRVVVDLGPFPEIMWVDGNFNASSAADPKYDVPQLQFGPVLKPIVDILQILATLSGDDFDKGMDVGMSNSPDNWEYKFNCAKEIPVIQFPSPEELTLDPNPPLKLEAGLRVGFYFNELLSVPTDVKQLVPSCGAFVGFFGRLEVMCFSLAAASVYAVGQVNLDITADSKAGLGLHMKFGFGVEIVVGLPVVGNVSVLYMVGIEIGIQTTVIEVGAMMLFRGSAEICGGLVAVCIQIEASGSVRREAGGNTECIAQVTFSIDITVLWVIDIDFSDSWQESRQIA